MMLDPKTLLHAYAIGVFPMADDAQADEIYWVEPKLRAIMPLDGFHLSSSLRRTVRSDKFTITLNRDFDRIVALCAQAAEDRPSTWINGEIRAAYGVLHRMGHAHSVEARNEKGAIVGGLYGVSLGRAFFGESMVSRVTDASKVALAHLVARMRFAGFTLLDCQFMTPHLASLGAIEISKKAYLARLHPAVEGYLASDLGSDFGAAAFAGAADLAGDAALAAPSFGRLSPPAFGAPPAAGVGATAPDLGALDALLAEPAALSAAGLGAGLAGVGSPGYVMAQLLTNTS
jgi:leucyl/phenylalanyl-tRNA---protein transferase